MDNAERNRLRTEVYQAAAAHNVMAAYNADDLDKIISAVSNDIVGYLQRYAAQLFFMGQGPNDLLGASEIHKIALAIKEYWSV